MKRLLQKTPWESVSYIINTITPSENNGQLFFISWPKSEDSNAFPDIFN